MPAIESWVSITIEQRTPIGKLFVTIYEDKNGDPIGVIANIGKSGDEIVTWARTLSAMITDLLQLGRSLDSIVMTLQGNTSSRVFLDLRHGTIVRSGIEGFTLALRKYLDAKYSRHFGTGRTSSMEA